MSTVETKEWRLPTAAEFQAFFRTELAQHLIHCEQDRQRVLRKFGGFVIGLCVVGVVAVGFVLVAQAPLPVLFIIAMLLVAGGGATYGVIVSGYRSRSKLNVVSQVVRFFGPDFHYESTGRISEGQFLSSRMFEHRIDRYRGEDYIAGTAGKTKFECSEVHAEYKTVHRTKNGTRTQWHTIFKGLFFIADFNKHFHGTTLVLPDVAQSAFGWIGQKLQEMNFSRPGDLVKLEDTEFEKLFVVYSTDQVEARYILSPALMQRLIQYRRKVGRPIHLSFINSSVYVAVDVGRNLLEPSVFKPVNFEMCQPPFAARLTSSSSLA